MSEASDVLNSLQHLCRICLHQLGEIKIFGEHMLDSTISLCLDILVLSNDGGPQSICCDCKDKLDGIMIFRLIGERSKQQLELFLGRLDDYYSAQVPNPESVECQPDVSTFALHTNDLPNDLMDADSLKEGKIKQIDNELLETETEESQSPPLVKQEIDSDVSSSVIRKTTEYPVATTSSAISIANKPILTPGEYNDVPTMKIAVRTDLISNRNDPLNIPASLNNDFPSTSGVNGNRVLLKAKTENSVEILEHKFIVPKNCVRRNLNAVHNNGIDIVKKDEPGSIKIIKQRSRRTSLEPCPPPICEICNKRFASRTSLYLHNRLHTQEKAHICSQCNKIFSSSTELSRHIRVHTGEKPYTCEICEKSFTQKVSLRKHQEKLHPVQKFEGGIIKPEIDDFKAGLVNQPNLNSSNYISGLMNQPDLRVGEYSGGLLNQQVNQLNSRAKEYDNVMVDQPLIGPSEYASGMVNQPNIGQGEYASRMVNQPNVAGESGTRLVDQPAIGASEFANSSVNKNGDVSVNRSDFSVNEQASDSMKQSIKIENSFHLSDVHMDHYT